MIQVGPKTKQDNYFLLLGKGTYPITPEKDHTHLHLTMGVAAVKDRSIGASLRDLTLKPRKFYGLARRRKFTLRVTVPAKIIFSIVGPANRGGPAGDPDEVAIDPF